METLIRGRRAAISVVDGHGDDCWVWWVNTAVSGEGMGSRKTGAWSLSRSAPDFTDKLENLLYDRMVVATAEGRRVIQEALEESMKLSLKWVDLDSTLNEVKLIRDEFQQHFDSAQAGRSKSNQLRELKWPSLPDGIDLESPPASIGRSGEAEVGRCLAIADWIDQLVRGYADIMAIRAERDLLKSAFPERNFPVVLTGSRVG